MKFKKVIDTILIYCDDRQLSLYDSTGKNLLWTHTFPGVILKVRILELHELLIILWDPYDPTTSWKRKKNLEGYDWQGNHIWTAELPGESDGTDKYVQVEIKNVLIATTFSGFKVQLDPSNGKIVNSNFVK